jgi:hypothetical protein
MPTHIRNSRNASPQRGADGSDAESGIATLWLVFCVIALAVAISSPLISRAIESALIVDFLQRRRFPRSRLLGQISNARGPI